MNATVQQWAQHYIETTSLVHKLDPGPVPEDWDHCPAMDLRPGRPPELEGTNRGLRTPKSLQSPAKRAALVHTFFHHELQAAELMCWAVLRFPEAPLSFRRGLIGIALDEVRHMNLYADYLREQGFALGDWPVRDWFWDRVPTAESPAHFVATMGLGFEGGNLDHAARFEAAFRDVGDEAGAALQHLVGHEEERHVAFAAHWFQEFTGGLDFEDFRRHLVAPLTPTVMRGRGIQRAARIRAGQTEAFIDALTQCPAK